MIHRFPVGLAATLLLLATVSAEETATTSRVEPLPASTSAFLKANCLDCHRGEKAKGDLRLDQLTSDFVNDASRATWAEVLDRVANGDMPPSERPRPKAEDQKAFVSWLGERVAKAEALKRASQGRVVLRRMNRSEYENTVRDLLGVSSDLRELLALDSSMGGFDNVGAALHISSFAMERYLDAADKALNMAIANSPKPPKRIDRKYSLQETHQVRVTTEKVFRKADDGSVVMFCSSLWQAIGLSPFYPPDRGHYRFRISASAVQSEGKPVVFRVLSGAGGMGGAKAHLVSYFDAPAGEPAIIEFVDHMEPRTSISILPYGFTNAQTVHKTGAENWDGPGLKIDWVEVEGPLHESWPPESHRQLFGDLLQAPSPITNQRDRVEVVSTDPRTDAEQVLRRFARRAFRRNVAEEDLQPFLKLFEDKRAEGQSFEQSCRVAFAAVMTSPEFLFLQEKPGRLDDFAIATRLSYFLWSTMPDEELLRLAEEKKLNNPETLHRQVERMLKHPKARAFTENFVGQWLGLRDIDFTMPSGLLYPEFDDMLKVSMVRETELFFKELLEHDLSLTNFVSSDFTMLNGRLAKHYGIPDIAGWEFQKTKLPPGAHRGGVLTMASVLKVTANGTTTSPVTRGAWVLERILGTPPPPPPENIPGLEPDVRGATTIREQLAKHREIESCAVCHKKIDPPGFALESFDVIGGWRENYRTTGNGKTVIWEGRRMPYHEGKPVDPSDVLPDGRAFKNIDEFKELLLTDKDQLARSLTTKLLTYATGAPSAPADRPGVEAIVDRLREKNYGLRTLVHEIVASDMFLTK